MEFQITKILSPFRFLCVFYPPRNFHSQFVFGLAIILILLLDLATVTYYAPFVFDVSTRVRFLLDISQVYAPVLSYAVIIIEAALSRHRLAMIWKNIESVVRIFERDLQMNTSSQLRGVLRKFILFGILIQLACTGIELGIILGIRKNASWLKNRWSAFPGFLGCRTAILLYILYVQIIGFLLESLGQCQRQITSQGVDRIPNRLLRFDRRRVERQLHLRRIFSKVALITRLLNESFKWSLLLNFLTNVFCICIAWFWNYVAFRFGNRYLFESILCSFPPIIITLAVVGACEKASESLKDLVEAVHLVRGEDRLRRMAFQFSLQLQLERIEWDVFKMFKLKNSLLTSIIATIGIYLVIFIQFMEVERGQ